MSRAAVSQFCQRIAKTPDLQNRLESGVKAGAGWDLFVAVGHEQGFDFTAQEATECFEHERKRRAACESAEHAETHILKHTPVLSDEVTDTLIWRRGGADASSARADAMSLNGLRRVALSRDWNIELPNTAADDDESIFS
jgi:hypothetical protein